MTSQLKEALGSNRVLLISTKEHDALKTYEVQRAIEVLGVECLDLIDEEPEATSWPSIAVMLVLLNDSLSPSSVKDLLFQNVARAIKKEKPMLISCSSSQMTRDIAPFGELGRQGNIKIRIITAQSFSEVTQELFNFTRRQTEE